MTEQDQNLLNNFKARLRLLMQRHDLLKKERARLEEQVGQLNREITTLKEMHAQLVAKYDNLKMVRVLAVSDEEKQQTKQRINKMVREIDKCIAQLNV